jgi:hypothetical protein
MKRNNGVFWGFAVLGLMAIFTMAGCDTGTGGGDGGGGGELLEVTHVTGFQGSANGSLLEIEVPSTADGTQTFTLYINGVNRGTGTLTISGGVITAIANCTDGSLSFFGSGVVTYSGTQIALRLADNKVWVHWGAYYGADMTDFNSFAAQHGRDADQMYPSRPSPDNQGYYFGYPSSPSYATPQEIYDTACQDHPQDRPPREVLNQAIMVLNNHRNTGVGAFESRGNLIAYYFRRVQ